MPYAGPGQTSPQLRKVVSAASTNATLVKAAPGAIAGYFFTNQHATDWGWLKLYNLAVAPTVGTSVPTLTFGLPPGGAANIDLTGAKGEGIAFGTGIALALTGDEDDADNTNVAAGALVINLLFD